jgi:membrane protease YdiL (CAAX protease family)
VISAWDGLALTALSFAALATFGAAWSAHGLGGTVLAELICVLVPAALVMWLRRVPPGLLGIARRPPWLAILGGLMAGAGAFYLVAAGVEPWLERVWPTPAALRETLQRMVIPASGARPIVVDLLALALVPAVAEELLFRGILWGALQRRLGVAATLLATSVIFGLYHGSIHRFVPAMLGGLLLGSVRASSGALLPAIAFHFANNAGVLVALHLGYENPPATLAPVAVALAASAIGVVLIRSGRCEPPPSPS